MQEEVYGTFQNFYDLDNETLVQKSFNSTYYHYDFTLVDDTLDLQLCSCPDR